MPLDPASRARIAPHVTSSTDDVYAMIGLPEEVVAVLFAYASRTGEDLRSCLARLLDDGFLDVHTPASAPLADGSDRARAFHTRWAALGGRGSVGEHAVVHLVVENVSFLAASALLNHRLAAYSEKSTRFLAIDGQGSIDAAELGAVAEGYRASAERLLAAHLELFPRTYAALATRMQQESGESEAAYAERLRVGASDLLRGLLPSGLRTTIAVTVNARALEALVTSLLSNSLAEVRRIGAAIRIAALSVVPRMIEKALPSANRSGMAAAVDKVMRTIYTPPEEGAGATMVITQPVRLVRYDKDGLERVALALAYEASDARGHAFGLLEGLRHATESELEGVVRSALSGRAENEGAPRAFEASTMTFEIMLDLGAYRELARHRMLTPMTQRFSCRLGFETPVELTELGLSEVYQEALLAAHGIWARLEEAHPFQAQYLVPLGFRVRALWTINLRELLHVIECEASSGAHPSLRRIAQAMARTACAVHPWLKDAIRADLPS